MAANTVEMTTSLRAQTCDELLRYLVESGMVEHDCLGGRAEKSYLAQTT